jgi:hypothetical protein
MNAVRYVGTTLLGTHCDWRSGCVKIRIGQRAGELACIKYGDGMGWEFLFPLLGSGEKRTCPFFWDGSVSCDRLLFIVWN